MEGVKVRTQDFKGQSWAFKVFFGQNWYVKNKERLDKTKRYTINHNIKESSQVLLFILTASKAIVT